MDDKQLLAFEKKLPVKEFAKMVYDEHERRNKKDPRQSRAIMPVVSRRSIGQGITEKKILYFWWIWDKMLGKEGPFTDHGKYQYLWSNGKEEISCVKLMSLFYKPYVYETCHPERRYKTVQEAR